MDNDSFYRPSRTIKNVDRTFVPDMYRQVAAEIQEEEYVQASSTTPSHSVLLQKRPLIGVLYSISAGIEGELFPLYVGRNTIGSDFSSDVCLRETSVSPQHGILLARKQTDANGEDYINVILSDTNSSYGTYVNGEKLNYEKKKCNDGDVISIGQNYVLVLSLFNALDKLTVADGFDRIPEQQKEEDASQPTLSSGEIVIGGIQTHDDDDHSTNITLDIEEETAFDLYSPSKQQGQNHYNNKTIII